MASSLDNIKNIEELDLSGKKVFIRLDLNVPIKNGVIKDDTRIKEALKTIRYALDKNAKVILSSHLGRPKGNLKEDKKEFSLLPVGERLGELLGVEVLLWEDPQGLGAKAVLGELNSKKILLLENSRFLKEEEKNSHSMAANLAKLTDVYINDGFGALHRAHATVAALPSLIKERGIGFLVKKEVEVLEQLLTNIKRPFWAILGGAKVSDKIGVIENLLEKVDGFVIGGAMAYTFLKAQNITVGNSLIENDKVSLAKDLLKRIEARHKKIILPIDHVVAKELKANTNTRVTQTAAINDGEMGLDIGPQTINLIKSEIADAKTVFWNGPMGAFETAPFEKGSFELAKILSNLSAAMTVVGGGDSVSAVKKAGLSEKMGHISTGGGASLEYLEGIELPGLKALKGSHVEPLKADPEDIDEDFFS
ncbi:MAG: phosphoglycerate kinase [Oligoflexia bacterium]|nr:phosphoglycerate kinase [Oligoflexia bacterium]